METNRQLGQAVFTKQFGEILFNHLKEVLIGKDWQMIVDHYDRKGGSGGPTIAEPQFHLQSANMKLSESRICVADIVILLDTMPKLVIEIEESGATPKKILGDILSIRLASHFRIGKDAEASIQIEHSMLPILVIPIVGNFTQKSNQFNSISRAIADLKSIGRTEIWPISKVEADSNRASQMVEKAILLL